MSPGGLSFSSPGLVVPFALMFFFALDESGKSGVLGNSLIADATDRMVYTVLIDLVEEGADGADGHFSMVSHAWILRCDVRHRPAGTYSSSKGWYRSLCSMKDISTAAGSTLSGWNLSPHAEHSSSPVSFPALSTTALRNAKIRHARH